MAAGRATRIEKGLKGSAPFSVGGKRSEAIS